MASNRYDEVPYPGCSIRDAHIRRLEAVGILYGLNPTPIAKARVLEIGCGTGGNLLPQALEFPHATFVGCDAAASHMAQMKQTAQAWGISNIEVWHADLCEANADWGRFDYILCHGVYSWVSAEVRQAILRLFRENLEPNGLAYLSYNALPGWHLRNVAREMTRFHAQHFDNPYVAAQQAKSLLSQCSESLVHENAYGQLVREEYLLISRSDDSYICHELLEEHNEAFHLSDVVEKAQSAALHYCGEAVTSDLFTWDMPESTRQFLKPMPWQARARYLDYFRGTTFRRSIFGKQPCDLEQPLDANRIDGCSLALNAGVLFEQTEAGHGSLHCGKCVLPCPDAACAMIVETLLKQRPGFVEVKELLSAMAEPVISQEGAVLGCQEFLLNLVTAGMVEMTVTPPPIAPRVTARPIASPLARLQAMDSNNLTNLRHETVVVEDETRMMLPWINGEHDREQLISMLQGESEDRQAAETLVDSTLEFLQECGMLAG